MEVLTITTATTAPGIWLYNIRWYLEGIRRGNSNRHRDAKHCCSSQHARSNKLAEKARVVEVVRRKRKRQRRPRSSLEDCGSSGRVLSSKNGCYNCFAGAARVSQALKPPRCFQGFSHRPSIYPAVGRSYSIITMAYIIDV
jgi:hypothetical protein